MSDIKETKTGYNANLDNYVYTEANDDIGVDELTLKQEPVVRCKDCISKPNNTCEVDLIRREDVLMQARPEYLNPQQEKLASYNQGWNDAIDEYFDRIKEIPMFKAIKSYAESVCEKEDAPKFEDASDGGDTK